MANRNGEREDKDIEFLRRFGILRIDRHPEKTAKFKTAKGEISRQFKEVNEDTFMALVTKLDSKDDIIESLKTLLNSYAHDLSQYMAVAEILNSEAVKNARLALSLAPIRPDAGPRRPRLSLVKA